MDTRVILRPISIADIDLLYKVAQMVGSGFTSLPSDLDYLTKRVNLSVDSFSGKISHNKGLYLFLMVTDEDDFVGICGIDAAVGNKEPFYNYKLTTISQSCESLKKYFEHETIIPANDFQGASELVSLFLNPKYRGKKYGEILSRARLLFIAEFSDWFSDIVFAEIRGVSNKKGISPFWEAISRPFFAMNFNEADRLTTVSGKQFISDLMPRHPIYLDFIPKPARKVLGQPHKGAAAAKYMLEREGFRYNNYVDIFDAGPVVSAEKNDIKTIRKSKTSVLNKCGLKMPNNSKEALICNTSDINFRLTMGKIFVEQDHSVRIEKNTAKLLNITVGDRLRFCELNC